MTQEQAAKVAQVLADRILDVGGELMHGAPVGEAAGVVLLAGLGAFASLVAAAGGTREGARLLVVTMLPQILDDVFEGQG